MVVVVLFASRHSAVFSGLPENLARSSNLLHPLFEENQTLSVDGNHIHLQDISSVATVGGYAENCGLGTRTVQRLSASETDAGFVMVRTSDYEDAIENNH